jgi:hypothetical protein
LDGGALGDAPIPEGGGRTQVSHGGVNLILGGIFGCLPFFILGLRRPLRAVPVPWSARCRLPERFSRPSLLALA